MSLGPIMRRSLACAGIVFFMGCAHSRRAAPASGGAPRLQVPFFPDGGDQCGPTALASVLGYWGVPAEPAALRREIYLPSLRGALPLDLLLAARARGLKAEMSNGGRDELRGQIDAGRPVIAFVNLGFRFLPIGHFLVVTGYDERGIYAHSGRRKNAFVGWSKFEGMWEKTGRWTLVISRPS